MYRVCYILPGYGRKIAYVCAESEEDAINILETKHIVGEVQVESVNKCIIGEIGYVDGRF